MTQQVINVGSVPGDGTGDRGQVPGQKVNANCTELYSNAVFLGTDSGTVNSFVVSAFAPQPAAPITLAAGMTLRFVPASTNSGPCVMNFAATGGRNIVNSLLSPLTGGEFQTGVPATLIYTGSDWMQPMLSVASLGSLINPPTAGELSVSANITNYWYQPLDPRRYGLVGDGVTPDTAAMTTWAQVANATANPTAVCQFTATVLTGEIPTITAANFTWLCGPNFSLLALPTPGADYALVTLTGNNPSVKGLTLNGNQQAFAAPNCTGLVILGTPATIAAGVLTPAVNLINPVLEDVTSTQFGAFGLIIDSTQGGKVENCLISNNAAFGMFYNSVVDLVRVGNIYQNNGWGFQVTAQPKGNAGIGMGQATWFRSTDVTIIGEKYLNNGKDGANTNTGATNVHYKGCHGAFNGDGNFTFAADTPAGAPPLPGAPLYSTRPGYGESCYNVSTDADCTSMGAWGGGFVLETVMYNLNIRGKAWNNGNGCGTVSGPTASIPTGVYVGNFSAEVHVDIDAYDDRQICPITAASVTGATCTLTATGWGTTGAWGTGGGADELIPNFTPTAGSYRVVKILSSGYAFLGYGFITAESAGLVTISSATQNGVTLSAIAAGCFVTQKLQDNGITWAASSQGTYRRKGFGYTPGALANATGYPVYLVPSNGINVVNLEPAYVSQEILNNPSWDQGIGPGWTYGGTGSNAPITVPGAGLHSECALNLISSGGTPVYGTSGFAPLTGIATLGSVAGSATNGTYPGTALAGGSGTGAYATVVVAGGVGTSISISTQAGTGYLVGDIVSATVTGGTVTGHVTAVTSTQNFCQDGIALCSCLVTLNSGLGAYITITNLANSLASTINHPGGGTRRLVVGIPCPAGSAPQMQVTASGDANVIFDEASIKMTFDLTYPADYYNTWPTRNLTT
jgi:hypothetical protein